jgi:hypothetical protein
LSCRMPREKCEQINSGPQLNQLEDHVDRENEGTLLVAKAGEMLFPLREPAS